MLNLENIPRHAATLIMQTNAIASSTTILMVYQIYQFHREIIIPL